MLIDIIIDTDELDSLLPASLPPQKDLVPKKLTQTNNDTVKRREWAHEINVNEPFDNFYDLVPEMAMQVYIKKKKRVVQSFCD